MSNQVKPEVGMGATCGFGSDCYPYTIIGVLKNDTMIIVQADNYKLKPGFTTYNTENQEYDYSPNSNAPKVIFTLRKNGRYVKQGDTMSNGQKIYIGNRRAYRDPHF